LGYLFREKTISECRAAASRRRREGSGLMVLKWDSNGPSATQKGAEIKKRGASKSQPKGERGAADWVPKAKERRLALKKSFPGSRGSGKKRSSIPLNK